MDEWKRDVCAVAAEQFYNLDDSQSKWRGRESRATSSKKIHETIMQHDICTKNKTGEKQQGHVRCDWIPVGSMTTAYSRLNNMANLTYMMPNQHGSMKARVVRHGLCPFCIHGMIEKIIITTSFQGQTGMILSDQHPVKFSKGGLSGRAPSPPHKSGSPFCLDQRSTSCW